MTALDVLIAEDSPTQASRLEELLRAKGYATRIAPDGPSALAMARQAAPSVLISDVCMPGMDGFGLCRALKATPSLAGVPVLLLTGLDDEAGLLRAIESGADGLLFKPVDADMLSRRIGALLAPAAAPAEDLPPPAFLDGAGPAGARLWGLLKTTYAAAVHRNRALEQSRQALESLNAQLEAEVHRRTLAADDARAEAEAARAQFRLFFEAAPGLYLVLRAADLHIVGVSEAYLAATMTEREQIVGRGLFEVFPDDPAEPGADGVRNLRASLERVRSQRLPDTMAVQRYPIRRPQADGGGFEERWWSPVNVPVPGPDGELAYIVHRVEDVTDYVRAVLARDDPGATDGIRLCEAERQQADVLRRSRELHHALEALRRRDALLSIAGRMAQLGAWSLELPARRLSWSDEVALLHGMPHGAQPTLEQAMACWAEPHRPAIARHLRDCIDEGLSFDVEAELCPPGAARRWLRVIGECERDAEGAIVAVRGAMQDISARKQGERRVQAQMARLQILNEITRAIADRLDLAEMYRVLCERVESGLGVDACLLLEPGAGQALVLVGVGPRAAALAPGGALEPGRSHGADELGLTAALQSSTSHQPELGRGNGDGPWHALGLRCLAAASLPSSEGPMGLLVVGAREPGALDGDDSRFLGQLAEHVALAARQARLHAALRSAYDDLQRSQQAVLQQERLRALGQLASGIAHDINNAISPASLYIQSLLFGEPQLSETGRERLRVVQLAVDDVAETVKRMRGLGRADDGVPVTQPADVNRALREVAERTRAHWLDAPRRQGQPIRLVFDLAGELPGVALREAELREALTNLVLNAVDAMPGGGWLRLRSRPPDAGRRKGSVVVEVVDSGSGMDEATRSRCLEPFFTTKGERGTGLGLAMVYGTLQRRGGSMEIDTGPGMGTTVRLLLPRFRAAGADSGWALLDAAGTQRSPLRLLLVDDDPVLLNGLAEMLRADGHEVTAVSGGPAARGLLDAEARCGRRFDAMITDLGMPDVDGLQLARAVRRADPRTRIVALGGADTDAPDQRLEGWVDARLSKPPLLHELRAALAGVEP